MSKYEYEIELSKNDGYRWTTTRVWLIAENTRDAIDRAVKLGSEPERHYFTVAPKIISCRELRGEE